MEVSLGEGLLREVVAAELAGRHIGPAPVVVHGVQHRFQRMRLERWPDAGHRSKLVPITHDLDRATIETCLQAQALAGAPAG